MGVPFNFTTVIGTTSTLIGSVTVNTLNDACALVLKNTGANDLAAFAIQRVASVAGVSQPWLSGPSPADDFVTLAGTLALPFVSTQTPSTLPSGATASLDIVPGSIVQLDFYATSAAGGTTVTLTGSGNTRPI